LAEEEKKPGGGSEIPVFKFDGGFDRAKYKAQEQAMITPDGRLTGSEIDDDLKKKKASVEGIEKEAIKFYDEKYDEELKKIDPGIDRSSVFYTEAESNSARHKKSIKNNIESGKAVDGKEIIDMAANSASNKIAKANQLKNGTVTQIAETLGWKRIEESGNYQEIAEDFNKKTNNEKLEFEKIINNLWSKFDAINNPENVTPVKYSAEDNALISALAKILEGEGFKNDSVTAMAAKYEENVTRLSASSSKSGDVKTIEGSKVESEAKKNQEEPTSTKNIEKITEVESKKESPSGAPGGSPNSGSTAESIDKAKVEENVSSGKGESASVSSMESNTPSIVTSSTSTEPNNSQGINEQIKSEVSTSKEEIKSIENSKITETNINTETKIISPEAEKKDQSLESKKETSKDNISPAEGSIESKSAQEITNTGTSDKPLAVSSSDTITDSSSNTSEGNKSESENKDSKLGLFESLFGKKYTSSIGGSEKGNIGGKIESAVDKISESKGVNPIADLSPKMDSEISKITGSSETSAAFNPIKETITQNLSSVIPSSDKKEETEKENPTEQKPTQDINQKQNISEEKSEITKNENETTPVKGTEEIEEKKEKEKAEKEMQENIKRMVTILNQLNTTLQNPLIVIPNEKKFV